MARPGPLPLAQHPPLDTQAPRTSAPSAPGTPGTPSRLHRFIAPFSSPGLTGAEWLSHGARSRVADADSSSIDWGHETAKERARVQALAELPGIAGVGARLWDSIIPWIVVVATGLGTGILAACLDMLSAWLSDMRSGVCRDTWWMSKGTCCAGLDLGETCNAWRTWGDVVGGHFVKRTLAQYGVYMALAVTFAVTASLFVQVYAKHAFHTGIPEIKTILGGFIIVDFLSGWTLLIKSLGLPLAVASGLSLGKEGPLVHVACCIGNLALQPFEVLRGNGARQRQLLSAAAAAGVSVAFGAPLGGVLFSLEEVSTFFPGSTLWQSFVCAIVAAVTLQYIDPFNTGKLVLFEVTTSQVLREFELIPWAFLGVCGGLWGAWFIHLNEEWERFRRASGLHRWPVTEVAALALFTSVVSYLVIFMRIPSSELVVNLFQDCSAVDTYGLCDTSKTKTLVALLLVTAFVKTILTAVTFGASVPAGIFLPSLVIGACAGRAVGLVMASIQRAHPAAWLFANCPADGACISPPVYAVVGAASALGGATRMTVSLVVILFELTGAVDLVLQIMMAVMISKFTADFFTKAGIYETWINLRNYPFLNNKVDYRNDSFLAKDVMTSVKDLVVLTDEGWTFGRIEALLESEEYRGFPIVRTAADNMVIGYVSRLELESAIVKTRETGQVQASTPCFFTSSTLRGPQLGPPSPLEPDDFSTPTTPSGKGHARSDTAGSASSSSSDHQRREEVAWVNFKPWVDETPICVNPETPMEVVVQMFQRLGLRSVLFTRQGVLAGIITKMDVHAHLQPHPEAVVRRVRPGAPKGRGSGRAVGGTPRPRRRSPVPLGRAEEEPGEELGLLDDSSARGSTQVERRDLAAWGL